MLRGMPLMLNRFTPIHRPEKECVGQYRETADLDAVGKNLVCYQGGYNHLKPNRGSAHDPYGHDQGRCLFPSPKMSVGDVGFS